MKPKQQKENKAFEDEVQAIAGHYNPCKAFTIYPGEGGWYFVTVNFHKNKIISVEKSEPDLRHIQIEKLKIANANWWTKGAQDWADCHNLGEPDYENTQKPLVKGERDWKSIS